MSAWTHKFQSSFSQKLYVRMIWNLIGWFSMTNYSYWATFRHIILLLPVWGQQRHSCPMDTFLFQLTWTKVPCELILSLGICRHHLLSLAVVVASSNFSKIFSSETNDGINLKLGHKHPWGVGFKNCALQQRDKEPLHISFVM